MRPMDKNCQIFNGVPNKNVFEDMCFAKFCILYEYNNQEPEKALWHIMKDCKSNSCDVSLGMIQAEINKNKKHLNSKSNTKNPDEDDDDTEDEEEDFLNDQDVQVEPSESNKNSPPFPILSLIHI